MKTLKSISLLLLVLLAAGFLLACSSGGDESAPPPTTSTTISGKVTISSAVASKPSSMELMKAMAKAANGKSGPERAKAMAKAAADLEPSAIDRLASSLMASEVPLALASVLLYDADHPEWLEPVAFTQADLLGVFTLDAMTSPVNNVGATYASGDPIPVGNYTLIASGVDTNTGGTFVAVQSIVKKYEGVISNNDLVGQDSDAVPSVEKVFGLAPNADGTFGGVTTTLASNAAIQVIFSGAMARTSVTSNVSVKDTLGVAVAGAWKVSSDLLAATFYPDSPLTVGSIYTVTIKGGKGGAANVFGTPIVATVTGTITTGAVDGADPAVTPVHPVGSVEKNAMPLDMALRFASDEVLDINNMVVSSNPSIGDKPAIIYIGQTNPLAGYPYEYEIVPSIPYQLATGYGITVSGGTDLSGRSMADLTFSFTTETTSDGIDGTSPTADLQAEVKDVFGKWVRAMNDYDTTTMSSIMAGDFTWINNTVDYDPGSDDLNYDGRQSLVEFTKMLDTWFGMLSTCSAVVNGTILDTINIGVNSDTADFVFSLNITTTDTNIICSDVGGPDESLYLYLEKRNGSWMLVSGGETQIIAAPAPHTLISLTNPVAENVFADPAVTGMDIKPSFEFDAVTGVDVYVVIATQPSAGFDVNRWVALINGAGIANGTGVTAKFTPLQGQTDNIIVVDNDLNKFKSGGQYYWSVIGLTGTDIQQLMMDAVTDPFALVTAASPARKFSVAGEWKEVGIVLKSNAGVEYAINPLTGGFDVGSADVVTLEMTASDLATADATATIYIEGYGWTGFTPTFDPNTGKAVQVLNLWQGMNGIQACEEYDLDNYKCLSGREFYIYTDGGIPPTINITSVTGKKCDGTASADFPAEPTLWGDYETADTCTVDITVNIAAAANIPNLWLNVGSENGMFNQSYTIDGVTPITAHTFTDVPIYGDASWVFVGGKDATGMETGNHFFVETGAGATYVPPVMVGVTVGVTPLTPIKSDVWSASYDAASAGTVVLDLSGWAVYGDFMPTGNPTGTVYSSCELRDQFDNQIGTVFINGTAYEILDAAWNPIASGAGVSSIPGDLIQGENILGCSVYDSVTGNGTWFEVSIYTTGGTPYTPPNEITAVSDTVGAITPDANGAYNTTDCTVTVDGMTTLYGWEVNAYNNFYDGTFSINDYVGTVSDPITGAYSITVPVYFGGTNWIDVYDGNGYWDGVQVVTTGASCVATPFEVTNVLADGVTSISPDAYGDYYDISNAASYVTITGTATTGRTVTAYDSNGMTNSVTANGGFSVSTKLYYGWNYINLTDGSNWWYMNVYTEGGSTYVSPITAAVTGGTFVSAGDNYGEWSVSGVSQVTVEVTSIVTGAGYYFASTPASSASGTIDLSTGVVNLPVDVYNGWNYIDLYDPNGAMYSLSIYVSGGVDAPQLVTITSPIHNSTAAVGAITVNVAIDNVTTGFNPDFAFGYVDDTNTGIYTYYSSNPQDQIDYGDLPITFTAGDVTFNFGTDITSLATPTFLQAWACDSTTYECHGHYVSVNNTYNYSEGYYKPDAGDAAKAAKRARDHKAEFRKRMLK